MGLEYPEASGRVGVPTEALRGGPPLPLWVTPDDLLIVGHRSSVAGLTLRLGGMIWHPDGTQHELNQNILPTSDRSLNFTSIPLNYGYLVHAAMGVAVGSPRRGQCLVSLQVARPPASAFRTRWFLGQDYLTSQDGVYWPFGRNVPGVEGPGIPRLISVAGVGAGSDWIQPLPSSARWRVWGVQAILVTSATVANRIPLLLIDDGLGVAIHTIPTSLTIPATTARTINWIVGYPSTGLDVVASQESGIFIPPYFTMRDLTRLKTVTTNIQAGDQWSGVFVFVEEWIED